MLAYVRTYFEQTNIFHNRAFEPYGVVSWPLGVVFSQHPPPFSLFNVRICKGKTNICQFFFLIYFSTFNKGRIQSIRPLGNTIEILYCPRDVWMCMKILYSPRDVQSILQMCMKILYCPSDVQECCHACVICACLIHGLSEKYLFSKKQFGFFTPLADPPPLVWQKDHTFSEYVFLRPSLRCHVCDTQTDTRTHNGKQSSILIWQNPQKTNEIFWNLF